MAGPKLSASLADLRATVKEMRELGVASWANSPIGDVILGPPPPPKVSKADADPNAERRLYYSEVLNHRISDVELKHLP